MKFIQVIALLLLSGSSFATGFSPNLTATYDLRKKCIKLTWQNNDELITAFVLQRSADNNTWTDLYRIEASGFSTNKIEKYTDLHPDQSKNYYRLKVLYAKNQTNFSASIMVIMGQTTKSWVMFPVPVTTTLNLQYTGSDQIQAVISVFIQNSQGKILYRIRTSSLNRIIQIPVSNLGKGIYDVRIMVKDEIVWNQRFLK